MGCSTCSGESRFLFCLHKLKNLTRWPNRPVMEIWVWISYAPLATEFVFPHVSEIELQRKRRKRINSKWKKFKTSSPALEYMPEEKRKKILNDHSIHYRGRVCSVNDFYVTQSDGYLHVKAKYLNIDVHQRSSFSYVKISSLKEVMSTEAWVWNTLS